MLIIIGVKKTEPEFIMLATILVLAVAGAMWIFYLKQKQGV